MTFTFYTRSPNKNEAGSSFPGLPRPDEILFTCEASDPVHACGIFKAYTRMTDIGETPDHTYVMFRKDGYTHVGATSGGQLEHYKDWLPEPA